MSYHFLFLLWGNFQMPGTAAAIAASDINWQYLAALTAKWHFTYIALYAAASTEISVAISITRVVPAFKQRLYCPEIIRHGVVPLVQNCKYVA